ncbi:hypothetical protein Bca52824_072482 [Brassica carinata]|uniref:Uncharacterized protein n=1 Tax=Brassica carinata TaxID=52824 RepID=A0A8X7Q8W0_BRACI|nr:hypothetical protein Bca52824_072482 [Brassica carinata]
MSKGNTNNNNKTKEVNPGSQPTIRGGSSTPPATQSPPYPSPAFYYPSPAENLPNYPSPASEGEGGGSFYGPPPPDAILPYFPYYFRNPSSDGPNVVVSTHVGSRDIDGDDRSRGKSCGCWSSGVVMLLIFEYTELLNAVTSLSILSNFSLD